MASKTVRSLVPIPPVDKKRVEMIPVRRLLRRIEKAVESALQNSALQDPRKEI